MNPETNKLEPLTENEEELLRKIKELGRKATDYHLGLLRPDGTPVPIHWSVFKIGELVTIKDYTFRVAYIGESNILFEPVRPDEPLESTHY